MSLVPWLILVAGISLLAVAGEMMLKRKPPEPTAAELKMEALETAFVSARSGDAQNSILISKINEKLMAQEKEMDLLQDHLGKLRESQLMLKHKLVMNAKKSSVVKITAPIPVRVMDGGETVRLAPASGTLEKVKKQIKELSK